MVVNILLSFYLCIDFDDFKSKKVSPSTIKTSLKFANIFGTFSGWKWNNVQNSNYIYITNEVFFVSVHVTAMYVRLIQSWNSNGSITKPNSVFGSIIEQ